MNNLLHSGEKWEFPGFSRFPGNQNVREIANPRHKGQENPSHPN